jgi:hypothetical protein
MMRHSPLRIGLAVTVPLALAITQNVAAGQIPERWKPWLWLAWPITVALSIVMIRSEVRQRRTAAAEVAGASATTPLDTAVERLARVIHEQWTDEAAVREITRPDPTPTSSSACRPCAWPGRDMVFCLTPQ